MKKFSACIALLFLFACRPLFAALSIEIVGGGENQIPISVVPFESDATGLSKVIADDLARSGMFKTIDPGMLAPHAIEQVNFSDWRGKGADAIVIGGIYPVAGGQYEVRFRLLDAAKQVQLAGFSYTVAQNQFRQTAHKIADIVYQQLTGDVGVFSTKIAYILKQGKHYELQVADADGFGAQSVVSVNEPIISPAWSPDGRKIAYVSFERGNAVVYVQDLLSGRRHIVADFKGSNSAPAWAPGGRQLAVVLSHDGSSRIYLVGEEGGNPKLLENSAGISTEPSFSPDGQQIIFTSDRGGSPQIYRIAASGGQAMRLTFEGNYNVSPHYSPDGKSFAYLERNGGHFNVAIQDFATSQSQLLTDADLDQSPTFAPNGKLILYASIYGGRGILAIVSSDGRIKQRLTMQSGDIREPAWGPLVH
ncbi:MAG: Tol-Pal system beta propeller repeat protein TolB [Burkholderiales bacterium]|nr:Tol-Pal system beta propeller repeat protein TolB [Burkholderiales bacterium]